MSRAYWVDWDSESTPRVRHIVDAPYGTRPITMTQARSDISAHFHAQIRLARQQIAAAHALRESDVRPVMHVTP